MTDEAQHWEWVILCLIFAITICSLEGCHQSRIFYHYMQLDDEQREERLRDEVRRERRPERVRPVDPES